jgi:predicted aspartyl protease
MPIRRSVALLALGSAFLIGAAPDDGATELVQGARDLSQRMTVPVTLDGTGPYQFVVDTAAERTVISRELAGRLALADGGSAQVVSITGLDTVDTALVPQLQLSASRNSLIDLRAPIMSELHLGASGLLGIDSLRTKRVILDFKAMRLTIVDAAIPVKRDSDEIVVTARRKLGQLIMVDAQANGQKISVIIDTGSQVTVGNPALRKQLERRHKLGTIVPLEIISVTGGKAMADYTTIAKAQIGGVDIIDLPVAFADAQIFHRLGLSEKPAMLLGMDVLRTFDRVSVDYANKSVRFLLPGDAFQNPPPMLASAPLPTPG